VTAKKEEATLMSFNWQGRKQLSDPYNGIPLNSKKKHILHTHNNTDESQMHYSV
jgi:hypothetical protein